MVVVVVKGEGRKFRAVNLIQQDMTINKLSILVIVPREIAPFHFVKWEKARLSYSLLFFHVERNLVTHDGNRPFTASWKILREQSQRNIN